MVSIDQDAVGENLTEGAWFWKAPIAIYNTSDFSGASYSSTWPHEEPVPRI